MPTWRFVSKGPEASQYEFLSSLLVILPTVLLLALCRWWLTSGPSHRSTQLCALSVRLTLRLAHLLWQSQLALAVKWLAPLHLPCCMQNLQYLGCPHLELNQQAGGWGCLLHNLCLVCVSTCIGIAASTSATFLSRQMEVWTFHWVLSLVACGQCRPRIYFHIGTGKTSSEPIWQLELLF